VHHPHPGTRGICLNTPLPSIPLVSIIVPLYNHARYVEATLESFRTEGYPALEVVIIDDGSTDDSFEIARDWLKAHPDAFKNVVLQRQENQGITKTLNRLISLSHGAFITMVASDDLLLPGGIHARLEALQARPDWLSVFGDATVINDQGDTTKSSALRYINKANIHALEQDGFRSEEIILRWAVPGPVLLSRREMYDPVRGVGHYDESMVIEDRSLYLRLLARSALGFVSRSVAAYRIHPRNTIKSLRMRRAVYDAVYRSEAGALERFSGSERGALEFIVNRSKLHLTLTDARGFGQMGIRAVGLLWNSIVLQIWLAAHDRRVRRTPSSKTT
jgi:glycosyltransferase involved in cell wall biosynthesis